MDYEKKYKEALGRMQSLYNGLHGKMKEKAEQFFPELCESEDERIRKEIISFIQDDIDEINLKVSGDYDDRDEDDIAHQKWCKKAIAWLEKQGEQKPQRMISAEAKEALYDKPADKIEPKFKVGDWIVDTLYDKAMQVLFLEDDGYEFENGIWISYTDAKERVHLWTIQDAKPGDVLYCESSGIEYIVMNKGINKCNNIDSYFRYNSINGFGIDIPSVLSAKCDSITPATKEQRDLLFSKMKEAGYEWDFEKKELKKIEQKSAEWSEEDENKIDTIISVYHPSPNIVNWLKSLKERCTWNPSDEQTDALKIAADGCADQTVS